MEKKLQKWLKPLLNSLDDFTKSLPDDDDEMEVVDFVLKLIVKISENAANLSTDQLRKPIKELLDIFENDLGLTGDFVQQQVWALVDDVIARLEQEPSASNNGDGKKRRHMALVIRRLKRNLQGQFTFPGFNADKLTEGILGFLRQHGAETVAKKTACYGEKAADIASAAGSLAKLVSYAGFGPNTVGAAESPPRPRETYLWYASWLLGSKHPWYIALPQALVFSILLMLPYPADDIVINNRENKLIRKKYFLSSEDLATGVDPAGWEMAEPLNRYSFSEINADTMEKVAQHTAYSCDFFEVLFHGLSIEPGDWLANLLFLLYTTSDAVCKLVVKEPIPPFAMNYVRFCCYTLGSLTGIHTRASASNGFLHWVTKAGTSGYEAFYYNSIAHGLRGLVLSIMTLWNHSDPGSGGRPAENYKEVGGIVMFVTGILTSYGLVALIPKQNYGLASLGANSGVNLEMGLGWWLAGSACTGLIGATVGTFVGQGIARNSNSDLWSGDIWLQWLKQWGTASFLTFCTFWQSYYMSEEGDTTNGDFIKWGNGGRYHPDPNLNFNGYPGRNSSPYLLPFRRGRHIRCIQGNQGLWSHDNFGNTWQIYAYDFDLDQGEEVLASRPGTVVDYFDWIPNDIDPDNAQRNAAQTAAQASGFLVTNQTNRAGWNFIVVRHDQRNTNHDLDQNGAAATTYAVYGHGRQNGVQDAFNSHSPTVAPNNIIGQTVNQGDVIMLAGDTGVSMYNHLHMDVRPGPAGPTSPPASPPAPNVVPLVNLVNRTIPFVYQDATHQDLISIIKWGQDGSPKSLNWYESNNG